MGVDVDEAGRHDQAGRVDRPARACWRAKRADRRDPSVLESRHRPRRAGAPEPSITRAAGDEQVVALARCPETLPPQRAAMTTAAAVPQPECLAPHTAVVRGGSIAPRGRSRQQADSQADDEDDHHPERVVPEERDVPSSPDETRTATPGNAGEQADERAVAVRAPEQQREDEHAEQRPVEKRSEAVHDLDERPEPRGERARRSRRTMPQKAGRNPARRSR